MSYKTSCGLLCLALLALTQASAVNEDYQFVPSKDPNPAQRAAILLTRQALIGYADLKAAGLTTFTTGYATNVSVPNGYVGNYVLSESVAKLTGDVIETSVPNQARLAATVASGLTFSTLSDFENLYSFWNRPLGLTGWDTDAFFGQLHLTYFPLYIRETSVSDLQVVNSYLTPLVRVQYGVLAALGSLFHVDCDKLLQTYGLSTLPNKLGVKASFALFKSESDGLTPLGIVVENQWVIPSDAFAWKLARMSVIAIESNLMPMTHFADTHLQIAPIALAMKRQMSENHPIYNLLTQSLDYDFGLMGVGFPGLFNKGVTYDSVSAWGAIGMHRYINYDWQNVEWDQRYLLNDLASRGVSNLRGYKYAEDMKAWNNVFSELADDFVSVYYKTNAEVLADNEVQAVFAEASNPLYGKLYGFPTVDTRDKLKDVLTHIMVSVVKHHATNTRAFSEVDTVFPYAPWTLNCTWPGKSSVTETFIVKSCMPDLQTMANTINLVVGFNRTYPASYSMKSTPQTRLLGTNLDHARKSMARRIENIDDNINLRTSTVLPYKILRSDLMPVSTFV